jgi:hypothetical protein
LRVAGGVCTTDAYAGLFAYGSIVPKDSCERPNFTAGEAVKARLQAALMRTTVLVNSNLSDFPNLDRRRVGIIASCTIIFPVILTRTYGAHPMAEADHQKTEAQQEPDKGTLE